MNKQYQYWLENNKKDYDALKKMDEKEIEKNFSTELEFGTGGVRAVMGLGSSLLNDYTVVKITRGYINYLKNTYAGDISIAIAYDNRNNSQYFSQLISNEFVKNGIKVHLYDELMPTPLLSYAVRELKCQGGVVLTASHNPPAYNGYKVYNPLGVQINAEQAEQIIAQINEVEIDFEVGFNLTDLEDNDLLNYIDDQLIEQYLNEFSVSKDAKKLKIVFSSLHGTAYKLVPRIFEKYNFNDVYLVDKQMQPDGNFTNTKSPNPEEPSSFDEAKALLVSTNADIGIVTDPDADRLGVIENGEEVYYFTGNQIGALLINYLLEVNSPDNKIVYKTIVTGDLGAMIAREKGVDVVETLTGFKYIGDLIMREEKREVILGYEESYGYIIKGCVGDKDAVQASLYVALMAEYYKNQGKTLKMVLDSLYQKYGYRLEQTLSYVVDDQNKINKTMNEIRQKVLAGETILGYEIASSIDYLQDSGTGLPKSDVIKVYLNEDEWLVFRPSGTEPKIKMYVCFVGDDIEKRTDLLQDQFLQLLNEQ